MKIIVKKLPGSEVEIEGELSADVFETYFERALQKLGEGVKLDGFRPGKTPKNVLQSNIPEIRILEEMAELALSESYPKILEENKIDAIGRPESSITKLARNNPLGFKIKTAVLPEIELGDYKDISKKVKSKNKNEEKEITVSPEEVENTIMDIRKSRAPRKNIADLPEEALAKEGHEEEKEVLPELSDEFVQALGPFKDVEDFKTKLKDNIKLEKENQQKEKTRLKIVENIIEDSKIEVPEILIHAEVDKILYKMESDIAQMGLKFEDYLKHLNKTADDLRKEFRNDGEKKAKLALILNKIAEIEKIVADEIQLEKEIAHILEHYKEADPERVRAHAENVLTNEQVFVFLENQ